MVPRNKPETATSAPPLRLKKSKILQSAKESFLTKNINHSAKQPKDALKGFHLHHKNKKRLSQETPTNQSENPFGKVEITCKKLHSAEKHQRCNFSNPKFNVFYYPKYQNKLKWNFFKIAFVSKEVAKF